MPTSPRMRWPYPSEDQNPWYEAFKGLITALDASGYASREDRHLIAAEGGTISWAAPILTWTDPIKISAAIPGFLWQLAAGSVSLDDGQLLYVTITRGLTANQTVTPVVSNQVPSSDQTLVLAARVGSRLYLRSGVSIADGDSIANFSPSPGAGPTGLQSSIELPRKDYVQQPVPVEEVLGQFMFDGSTIPTGGSVRFRCMMNPTFSVAGSANVHFYDLGPAAGPPAAPTLITGVSPSTFALEASASGLVYIQTAVLALGPGPAEGVIMSAPRMYEATIIQSSAPADTVDVGMASIFTEI